MSHTITDICDSLFAASKVDYVAFWDLDVAIKERFPGLSTDEHRKAVLEVVKCLLDDGLIAFTFLHEIEENGGHKKEIWNYGDSQRVFDRINTDWAKLKRDPSLGDICWFIQMKY